MVTTASAEYQARSRALRERFAAGLAGRLDRIRALWADYCAGSSEARDTLFLEVHSLAGSAASFGFARLGWHAREIEELIDASAPGPMDMAVRAHVGGMISKLPGLVDAQELRGFDATTTTFPPSTESTSPLYVVDHDPGQTEKLVQQVRQFGYAAEAVAGPGELAAAVVRRTPAAIVMDVVSPTGDLEGVHALVQVQSGRADPLPVLFVSSRDDIAARLEAVRAGARAYFTKPIDVGLLVDKLDEITAPQGSEPYLVMIVDDDAELAEHHALILKRAGMNTVCVTDPLASLDAASEHRPDLILMDVHMPGCSGLELALVLRQQQAYVGLPIVFLSEDRTMDRRLAAIDRGADDYLTKPIAAEHLVSSVGARAYRSRVLRALMVKDSLTGLLNHTALKQRLDLELARAQRQSSLVSFAMLDIDCFKNINDSFGHQTGDRIIKSLARLLQQRLRKTDVIGRYGGEEFAVILPDTGPEDGSRALDDIRNAFSQIRLTSEGHDVRATFSCGIASFPACESGSALCAAADAALYRAKAQGRNRLVIMPKTSHQG